MTKASKKQRNPNAGKAWREAELIKMFKLNRIVTYQTPLMDEWLDVQMPILDVGEQYNFDRLLLKAQKSITGWSEEDLKVKFIGPVLELGHLTMMIKSLAILIKRFLPLLRAFS